jgi:fructokinase
MKALFFGEILWDIIEGKAYLGGAPFNVAAHIAKCGAYSYIISRLGKDDLGKKAMEEIKKLPVDPSLVQWDEHHPTGTVDVFLEQGQPDYTIHENVAYDFIETGALKSALPSATLDCFYFGTLAQRNDISRHTLQWILNNRSFSLVFYDVNLRKGLHSKEIIENSLRFCNVFKLNQDEVAIIGDLLYGKSYSLPDFAEAIQNEFDVDILVITASEKGCYVAADEFRLVPGKKVQLVDAVGAGDAFSAAFLFKYFQEKDPFKAAEAANKLGAFVASSRGPIPDYSPEIMKILEI